MQQPGFLDDHDPIFVDLDTRPDLLDPVLALYKRFGPGRYHAVNGEPARMAQTPRRDDLTDAMGVLIALGHDGTVAGAITICDYSDRQTTLWGPVVDGGYQGHSIGPRLLLKAKEALAEGGYESIRVLVDTRNRRARHFFLSHGLSPWKDNHIYEFDLSHAVADLIPGIALARPEDHAEVTDVLMAGFPETGHCDVPLTQRERDGYRHYILQDGGTIIAVAAINHHHRRSWLGLYAVHPDFRGRGYGQKLLQGIIRLEAADGCRQIALEVLSDNDTAIHLYEQAGFMRKWTASILVGPL